MPVCLLLHPSIMQLAGLQRSHMGSHELHERVQVLEGRLAAATGSLSPFSQSELLGRVETVEHRTRLLEEGVKQQKYTMQEVLEPRLQVCETRLAGVYNLSGHLSAVQLVAAELGIDIPMQDCSTASQLEGQSAAAANRPSHFFDSSNGRPAAGTNALGGASSSGKGGSIAGNVLTKSRQQELQQQIDTGRDQTTKLQQQLEALQQQMSRLAIDAESSQDRSMTMLAALQDTAQGLEDRLSVTAGQLRRDLKATVQQAVSTISLADIMQTQAKLDAAEAAIAATTHELRIIKGQELPALSAVLETLQHQVGPEGAAATAGNQIADLKGQIEALRARLDGLTATMHAGQATAGAGVRGLSRLLAEQQMCRKGPLYCKTVVTRCSLCRHKLRTWRWRHTEAGQAMQPTGDATHAAVEQQCHSALLVCCLVLGSYRAKAAQLGNDQAALQAAAQALLLGPEVLVH
eukprot:GHRR01017906.1.p1 GENE.GHRR01017906.1~~GHRR01017906.1.p1  ORF type:complete len:462 (+),score=206.71 GHRR01017906.1:903-2288(+)